MTIIINYHEDFLLFVKSVNDYRLRNLEERYRIIYAHRHRIDTPNHTENTENTAANFPLSDPRCNAGRRRWHRVLRSP